MKSKEWLDRQNRDFYVKKAKQIGYVSRSAYKILEIEKKFKLINNSKNILPDKLHSKISPKKFVKLNLIKSTTAPS